MRMIPAIQLGWLPRQYKRRCNILSSSLPHIFFKQDRHLSYSLTLLGDSSSSNRPSLHEMSTFNFWARVPLGVHSFIIYSFLLDPLVLETLRLDVLIPALSFATVFFHVRTHSIRAIFLAVIKLLETHQHSRPHCCISFLLNVTGQTTLCPFVKVLFSFLRALLFFSKDNMNVEGFLANFAVQILLNNYFLFSLRTYLFIYS